MNRGVPVSSLGRMSPRVQTVLFWIHAWMMTVPAEPTREELPVFAPKCAPVKRHGRSTHRHHRTICLSNRRRRACRRVCVVVLSFAKRRAAESVHGM